MYATILAKLPIGTQVNFLSKKWLITMKVEDISQLFTAGNFCPMFPKPELRTCNFYVPKLYSHARLLPFLHTDASMRVAG